MSEPASNVPEAAFFSERLGRIREEIARRRGADNAVQVVAVTKGFDESAIKFAQGNGLPIGENYAQELVQKIGELDEGVRGPVVHFIGQLQSNKVRILSDAVDVWESVDRRSLITEIAKRNPMADIFIQANVSDDPKRGGCDWEDIGALVGFATENGLNVRGLMTVGIQNDLNGSRLAFRRLGQYAQDLGLNELSMGMSDDWQVAIDEGATSIRLGRALFGLRG